MLPDKKSRFIPVLSSAAALVMLLMLAPVESQAATLGDELILSRLGDPVEVEIAVLQWDDVDFAQLQISAGSPAVYESFGLDYLPVLDSLKFNLVGPNLDGDVKVLVSTREPILEPYLQLLLVLRWPGGSLLREYVLLFDPPRSGPTPAVFTSVDLQVPASLQPPQSNAEPVVTAQAQIPTQPVVTAQAPQINAQPVVAAEREETAPTALQAETLQNQDPISAIPSPASTAPDIGQEPESVVEQQPLIVEQQPVIDQKPIEPLAAVVHEVVDAQIPAPQNSEPDTAAAAPQSSSNGVNVVAVQQGGTYLVQAGDSLWDIASRLGPPNADLYQILLSLHELNQDAFSNGNISLLQSGTTLQLPTTADAARIDVATAQNMFEQRWREGSAGTQATQSGEVLPALSSLLAPEIVRPEVNPTAELQNNPEVSAPDGNSGGGVIVTSNALVPAPATVPGQNQRANAGVPLSSAEATNVAVQFAAVASTAVASAPAIISLATDTATSASVNLYMDGISASAQFMQDILAAKRQQVALLETQMSAMDTRMQEISQVTAQLNTSLEAALTQRDRQQKVFRSDNLLLGGVILLLSSVLIAIIVLAFKVAAQIRVQHLLLQSKIQPLLAGATGSFSEPAAVTNIALVTTANGGAERSLNNLVAEHALAVPILEEEQELEPAPVIPAETVNSLELDAAQDESAELAIGPSDVTPVASPNIASAEATPIAPPNDLVIVLPADNELDKSK